MVEPPKAVVLILFISALNEIPPTPLTRGARGDRLLRSFGKMVLEASLLVTMVPPSSTAFLKLGAYKLSILWILGMS